MIKKKISVTTQGHGENEYIFHHGMIVVNEGTRGIMFAGQSKDTKDERFRESKYLPFQLIIKVEIEDYDGGQVICRSPEFLSIAIDVSESMPILEVIE